MLREFGKLVVLWFPERISFIVFQVFLISNLYLLNVDSKKSCLATRMLLFSILLLCLKIYVKYFVTSPPRSVPPVAASPRRNEPPVNVHSPMNVPTSPRQSPRDATVARSGRLVKQPIKFKDYNMT